MSFRLGSNGQGVARLGVCCMKHECLSTRLWIAGIETSQVPPVARSPASAPLSKEWHPNRVHCVVRGLHRGLGMGEAKRRRGHGGIGGDRPTGPVRALDLEEMLRVGRIIHEAAAGHGGPDPGNFQAPVGDAMGAFSANLKLTDDPFAAARRDLQSVQLLDTMDNRIGMAVTAHYQGDRDRVLVALTRFWAMVRRMEDAEAKAWLTRDPAGAVQGVHNTVVEVAATLPIEPLGDFPANAFWRAVESRAAGARS